MLEQRSQTGRQENPGKVFCGFPACPAEFAVLGMGEPGRVWLLRAQDHIPALPPALHLWGQLEAAIPPAGKSPARTMECWEEGVCFGQLKLFSLLPGFFPLFGFAGMAAAFCCPWAQGRGFQMKQLHQKLCPAGKATHRVPEIQFQPLLQ